MSFVLASIVEGKSEVQALPVLLRLMLSRLDSGSTIRIRTPIRSPRDRFIRREEERRKSLELARRACTASSAGGHILVLLDADDDCPVSLARDLQVLCEGHVGNETPISVVLANREYEAWFLASAASLNGVRGFDASRVAFPDDPDTPRDAKGLVRKATGGKYGPAKDQTALSSKIDPDLAATKSRSFRKLASELERIVESVPLPLE